LTKIQFEYFCLQGDMGIETDEDFGVQLPALIVEPKKEKG
jgi:hypothetical protein